MIKYSELMKYPHHYFTEFIQLYRPETLYAIYHYGPYLTMHFNFDNYYNSESICNYHNNPVFRFIMDHAMMIKTISDTKTYGNAKDFLLWIIRNANQYDNDFSQITASNARKCLDNLRSVQYETKSTESAMLNYAPIVPYAGTIVKPGMEDTTSEEHSWDDNRSLSDLLKTYIFDILKDSNRVIPTDFGKGEIPPMLLHHYQNITNPVSRYWIISYLKYKEYNPNEIKTLFEKLKEMDHVSNQIYNKESIDIHKAVEAYMDLTE